MKRSQHQNIKDLRRVSISTKGSSRCQGPILSWQQCWCLEWCHTQSSMGRFILVHWKCHTWARQPCTTAHSESGDLLFEGKPVQQCFFPASSSPESMEEQGKAADLGDIIWITGSCSCFVLFHSGVCLTVKRSVSRSFPQHELSLPLHPLSWLFTHSLYLVWRLSVDKVHHCGPLHTPCRSLLPRYHASPLHRFTPLSMQVRLPWVWLIRPSSLPQRASSSIPRNSCYPHKATLLLLWSFLSVGDCSFHFISRSCLVARVLVKIALKENRRKEG